MDGTPALNLKDRLIPPNFSSWQWQIALLISSCPKIDFDLLALLNYRSAYLILVVCFDLMRPLAILTVFSSIWAKCVNRLAACVADSALLLNLKPGRPWSMLTSTRSGPIQFDFPQKILQILPIFLVFSHTWDLIDNYNHHSVAFVQDAVWMDILHLF